MVQAGETMRSSTHLFEQGYELVSLGTEDLGVVLNVFHAPFNVQQGVLQLVSFPHHVDEFPLEKASLESKQIRLQVPADNISQRV